MRAEKGFLRNLLGLGGVPQHAQSHAEHAVLVRGHELFEGARLARAQPIEESGRIGTISFPHG